MHRDGRGSKTGGRRECGPPPESGKRPRNTRACSQPSLSTWLSPDADGSLITPLVLLDVLNAALEVEPQRNQLKLASQRQRVRNQPVFCEAHQRHVTCGA